MTNKRISHKVPWPLSSYLSRQLEIHPFMGDTTVTYGITSNNDDGYWRTSKTYAHDPFANNLYTSAVKGSGDFYIGFDRY
tara:strand:+ start:788 stop:1027 length:240 start_codon:yes stop_codon:yes gene_type:complete